MESDPLPEVVSSHLTDWGLPVSLEGFEDQRVSAWLEMAPGYLAATQQLCDLLGEGRWQDWWQGGDSQVVMFFGSDNCWNHTLFYPALLHALDPALRPPRAFVSNFLYRLEGEKFSTSRGHAIWGSDLVEETSADVVRFYLGYTAPEQEATNFARREFETFIQEELMGRWQSWLGELGETVARHHGGRVPEAGAWASRHHLFQRQQTGMLQQIREALTAASFSLQKATRLACEMVRLARNFAAAESHWGQSRDDRRFGDTAIALQLAAARTLATMTAPLMPDFGEALWHALGHATAIWSAPWPAEAALLPAGQGVELKGVSFFPDAVREEVAQSA
jgi:methionyl-tRNA synthetase